MSKSRGNRHLRQALAVHPGIPAIEQNLSLAYFKAGAFASAIKPLRSVVATQPDNIQAKTLLGISLYGTHRFEEAAQNREVLTGSSPGRRNCFSLLSDVTMPANSAASGRKRLPLSRNWRKTTRSPRRPTCFSVKCWMHQEGGRKRFVSSKSPQSPLRHPQVHFTIGYVYWKTKRFDQAKKTFQAELKNNPSNARAEADLADIYVRRQQFQQALPLLCKATQQDTGTRVAWLNLGIVYTHQREFQKATQELKTAIRLDPSQTDAYYRLAMAHNATGQTAEAKAELAIVNRMHAKTDRDLKNKVSSTAPSGQPGKP